MLVSHLCYIHHICKIIHVFIAAVCDPYSYYPISSFPWFRKYKVAIMFSYLHMMGHKRGTKGKSMMYACIATIGERHVSRWRNQAHFLSYTHQSVCCRQLVIVIANSKFRFETYIETCWKRIGQKMFMGFKQILSIRK